jgi:CopG family transcriptional regulator / antitoxin EndoAI
VYTEEVSKRINVILPDATAALLQRVAAAGSRSHFIDRAVRHFVESEGRRGLRERLKAGYIANAEQDLAIATEWFPLEEEAAELTGLADRKMEIGPRQVNRRKKP